MGEEERYTLESLPEDVAFLIFKKLPIVDVCNTMRVCKSWQRLGSLDAFWKLLAENQAWSHASEGLNKYGSYKDLVLHQDRKGVSAIISSESCHLRSRFRYDLEDRCYECAILQVEFLPSPSSKQKFLTDGGMIRYSVYLESRGESDLRLPESSWLAVQCIFERNGWQWGSDFHLLKFEGMKVFVRKRQHHLVALDYKLSFESIYGSLSTTTKEVQCELDFCPTPLNGVPELSHLPNYSPIQNDYPPITIMSKMPLREFEEFFRRLARFGPFTKIGSFSEQLEKEDSATRFARWQHIDRNFLMLDRGWYVGPRPLNDTIG